jgi:hypothetical protein
MISDRDRLDRIERKVNRIGRFVLFAIALAAILAAIAGEPYYSGLVMATRLRVHLPLLFWRFFYGPRYRFAIDRCLRVYCGFIERLSRH